MTLAISHEVPNTSINAQSKIQKDIVHPKNGNFYGYKVSKGVLTGIATLALVAGVVASIFAIYIVAAACAAACVAFAASALAVHIAHGKKQKAQDAEIKRLQSQILAPVNNKSEQLKVEQEPKSGTDPTKIDHAAPVSTETAPTQPPTIIPEPPSSPLVVTPTNSVDKPAATPPIGTSSASSQELPGAPELENKGTVPLIPPAQTEQPRHASETSVEEKPALTGKQKEEYQGRLNILKDGIDELLTNSAKDRYTTYETYLKKMSESLIPHLTSTSSTWALVNKYNTSALGKHLNTFTKTMLAKKLEESQKEIQQRTQKRYEQDKQDLSIATEAVYDQQIAQMKKQLDDMTLQPSAKESRAISLKKEVLTDIKSQVQTLKSKFNVVQQQELDNILTKMESEIPQETEKKA